MIRVIDNYIPPEGWVFINDYLPCGMYALDSNGNEAVCIDGEIFYLREGFQGFRSYARGIRHGCIKLIDGRFELRNAGKLVAVSDKLGPEHDELNSHVGVCIGDVVDNGNTIIVTVVFRRLVTRLCIVC